MAYLKICCIWLYDNYQTNKLPADTRLWVCLIFIIVITNYSKDEKKSRIKSTYKEGPEGGSIAPPPRCCNEKPQKKPLCCSLVTQHGVTCVEVSQYEEDRGGREKKSSSFNTTNIISQRFTMTMYWRSTKGSIKLSDDSFELICHQVMPIIVVLSLKKTFQLLKKSVIGQCFFPHLADT